MVNKTGTPILRVKDVSKTFGGVVCALDDVSLERQIVKLADGEACGARPPAAHTTQNL